MILAPRQVGKTTLARAYTESHLKAKAHFFDLENPLDLARLENPMLALSKLSFPLVVIDEVQLRPDLFPILRVLIDQKDGKQSFLIFRKRLERSDSTVF